MYGEIVESPISLFIYLLKFYFRKMKLNFRKMKLNFRKMKLNFSKMKLNFRKMKLNFGKIKLNFRKMKLNFRKTKLSFRMMNLNEANSIAFQKCQLFIWIYTFIVYIISKYMLLVYICMYHQQQNKWYPSMVFTCHFRRYTHTRF